jgi:superkiller protein 3
VKFGSKRERERPLPIDEEDVLQKNRIQGIETLEQKGAGIKKPVIILSSLVALTVISILVLVTFFYKKPEGFTPKKTEVTEEKLPFDEVKTDISLETENKQIKKGIESYSRGYLTDAVSLFTDVVESDAGDTDKAVALTYLGMIANSRGEYDKALEFYNRAIVYNKKHPAIYMQMAITQRHKKEFAEALKNTEKSLSLKPGDINTMLLLGNIYFELGKFKDAGRVYSDALKLSPENPSLLFNLGASMVRTGDEFAAAEYFKKAGSLDSKGEIAYRAYSRLGIIYTERNQYDLAVDYLKKASAIRPGDPVSRYNLGIAYLKQNKKNKALSELEKAEELGNRDAEMVEKIGEAYYSLKDYERSLNTYNILLKTRKRNVKILSRIGELYYKRGELDRAYNTYRKITEIEPATENARIAYLNMGNIMDDAGRHEDAIKAYEKAMTISSKDASALYNLGIAYKHAGKPERAIESWKESARLNTKSPAPHLAIADYYYEKKFYDLAEKEFQTILSRWPENQDAHFKIATIYYKRNNPEYALNAYRKVLELNENSELARKAMINIAIISSNLNRDEKTLEESTQLIQKALLMKPADPQALISLGIIFSRKEMHDRAIDTFYQALRNTNESKLTGEIYNNIGKNYFKKKLYRKSLQAFTRGLEEDPASEEIRINRKAAMQAYETELSRER